MIFNDYLDDIDFPQLVALLSIFFETKNSNTLLSDLSLTSKEKYLINKAKNTSEYYLSKELELEKKLPIQVYTDYNLTFDNYQATKDWADGKSWKYIKTYYNSFEGDFSKIILRIHNVLREIKLVFSILNKNHIVNLIDEHKDSILREIIQTESLYLL